MSFRSWKATTMGGIAVVRHGGISTVINGILWKLRTGSSWRDLQERYGPWQTCYNRFVRWRRDGTWDRLLAHAQTRNDTVGEVE